MKILATILLFCGLSFAQGTELLRPTADSNTGSSSWVNTNCGIGTYVNNSTSGSLARDDAGQATSMSFIFSNNIATNRTTARTFSTWASTANSYSALTLNIASGSSGLGGAGALVYSTNAGSSWTKIRSYSGVLAKTVDTVAINAGQDLSMLRVAVCLDAVGFDPGTATITVNLYDIWTSGTLGSAAAGNGSSAGTAVQPVQFN